jgi:hypothetical protein
MGWDVRIAQGRHADMRRKGRSVAPARCIVSSAVGFALPLALAGVIAGCSSLPNSANPIEWYRGLSGADKNDDRGGLRNAENLAAGAQEPFPNLGTVPPAPDRVMTALERERLQQSLASEREGAQKSNEALQGGRSIASAEPAAPNSDTAPALTLLPPLTTAPPPSPNAGQRPTPRNDNASRQLPPKGSEEPPVESPGVSPGVRVTPEGETPRLAPPAPKLPPPFVAQPKVPPPPPKTAAITPQAAPPAPDLATHAAAPPRATGATQSRSLGLVAVAADAGLSAADQGRLAEMAHLQQQGGGTLRLVGYARRGAGAEAAQQEMTNFSQAINRANIVAKALTDDGVPSKQIAVEAAPLPNGGNDHEGRTEIFLER